MIFAPPCSPELVVSPRRRFLIMSLKVKEALAKSPDSIRCVDASWHLGGNRNANEEFKEGHLPGAVFFDIDKIADTAVPLPHM